MHSRTTTIFLKEIYNFILATIQCWIRNSNTELISFTCSILDKSSLAVFLTTSHNNGCILQEDFLPVNLLTHLKYATPNPNTIFQLQTTPTPMARIRHYNKKEYLGKIPTRIASKCSGQDTWEYLCELRAKSSDMTLPTRGLPAIRLHLIYCKTILITQWVSLSLC